MGRQALFMRELAAVCYDNASGLAPWNIPYENEHTKTC